MDEGNGRGEVELSPACSCSSLEWFFTCFLRLLGSVYLFWQPGTSHLYGFCNSGG